MSRLGAEQARRKDHGGRNGVGTGKTNRRAEAPKRMTRTIAALAAIVLFAVTGAEAQTGEWEIIGGTDEWGDPDPKSRSQINQIAETTLITAGGESETVAAMLSIHCDPSRKGYVATVIVLGISGSMRPNLEEDRPKVPYKPADYFRLFAKIDGIKQRVVARGTETLFISSPIGAKESLEILFAWGEDGQRQSLTWSMEGLSEAFAEACGEELDAEGE